MTSYRISEVAERTGFSPATLRYYEEIGVLPAAARSETGYRQCDERAIERLGFVARVKQLGLTLDEIGDLTQVWDTEACPNVQVHMADVVARRLAETEGRIDELSSVATRLREAADRLGEDPSGEMCDPGCPCQASSGSSEEPPPAVCCTLDAGLLPERREAWRALAGRAVFRSVTSSGVRLVLAGDPGLAAEVAALAEAEQACCSFLSFTVGLAGGRVTLDVRAPDGVDVPSAISGVEGGDGR